MKTRNSEHIVERDDVSKNWPMGVTAAFVAAIQFVVPKGQPILEIGVGTGQIALALADQQIPVVGLDPSVKPLKQTDKNNGLLQLIQGNISALSFADDAFKAIYSVNPLLVADDFSRGLDEIQRVLAPGGMYLNRSSGEISSDVSNHMDIGWGTILARNNVKTPPQPGMRSKAILDAALQERGATCETIPVGRWREEYSPRIRLDRTAARLATTDGIPQPVIAKCLADYERWLKSQYSKLDTRLDIVYELALDIWRWG